ncbi:predicted protein [Thalassiosira pseudonana CCMP1335]|uniref:Hexosyltransferase n=1 Tax=Thalassiosira pseudonana TaxID=35128 RepID=B8BYF7_THAPS|nr:predicted protein [Thalassiosira pseudonana CCMP1335]EED93880.1 predicted protein [Thalassiosira pseudonana CCMP1335]
MPSLRVIFAIILLVSLATQIGTLLTFHLQRDGYVKDANLIRSTFDTGEKTTSSLNSRDVIVYLAQFGNHSTYGSPAFTKLNKSIDLLYTNYLNDFPCDVIIFHDSTDAPDSAIISSLATNRPNLQFRELTGKWWELPHGLKASDHKRWRKTGYSIGYRHMMRWFGILIWKYLTAEGYSHVMRMDDDSFIHSKIQYDLFQYLRVNGKRYAFRQPVVDDAVGKGYDEMIDKFLIDNSDATTQELSEHFKRDRNVGFYNNWFMADLSFFASTPVSTLLDIIDKSKLIYTQRTGDLVIHSTVVRLFLRPEEIYWARDFTYEHMTLCTREKCKGCPNNGGISRGVGVSNAEWNAFVDEVRDIYNGCTLFQDNEFIGAKDVGECSRLESQCGFYLELLLS